MELSDNQYHIQGIAVSQICEEFGTPLYVYDSETILSQYTRLQNAFSGTDCRIKYAAKALTNINILKLLKRAGAGLDVVSIQEAKIGIHAGFEPQQILYTPNCVSFEEIKAAVELGVVINIDNISILEQFGHTYGDRVPCCIRINPHLTAGGNRNIQVGSIDSKFGISVWQMHHVKRVVEADNIRVIGLHMHTGSDILDSEVFIQAARILFEQASDYKSLEFIDLGSGFKVGYRPGDVTTDIEELGQKMSLEFNRFRAEYGRKLQLWFEPGKFLVSESGTLFVRVNVIKHTPAGVFVGVDSGMNHLLRPMMYEAFHDMVNVSNPEGTHRVYNVVGYICETDTFGRNRKLNEVREGDVIGIRNAGAYGFSMASNYNSRLRPAEVLVHEGKACLIRRRETMQDLIRGQTDIFEEESFSVWN